MHDKRKDGVERRGASTGSTALRRGAGAARALSRLVVRACGALLYKARLAGRRRRRAAQLVALLALLGTAVVAFTVLLPHVERALARGHTDDERRSLFLLENRAKPVAAKQHGLIKSLFFGRNPRMRPNPYLIRLLDQFSMCVPLCSEDAAFAATRAPWKSSSAEPCNAFSRIYPYFAHAQRPSARPRLAVLVPYARSDAHKLPTALAAWGEAGLLPCGAPADAEAGADANADADVDVDLWFWGPGDPRALLPAAAARCFAAVHADSYFLDSAHDTHDFGSMKMFRQFIESDKLTRPYDYVFWMELDTVPVRANWLQRLRRECADASPFLLKGSAPTTLDDGRSAQMLSGFTPTQYNLHINGNALYGTWHDGFVQMLRDLLAEADDDPELVRLRRHAFDVLISTFMLQTHCSVKFFARYMRWSDFVLNDPRIFNLSAMPDTYFVHKLPRAPCTGARRYRPGLEEWVPRQELERWSRASRKELGWPSLLRRLPFHGFLNETRAKLRASCDSLVGPEEAAGAGGAGGGHHIGDDIGGGTTARAEVSIGSVSGDGGGPEGKRRLLVAMVFTEQQLAKLLYNVARWDLHAFAPCAGNGTVLADAGDAPELLLLHSGQRSLPRLADELLESVAAVRRCFRRVRYQFVQLPRDRNSHDCGSSTVFHEMMLGEHASAFDHVLQLEPDVYPIRSRWLDKVRRETLDAAPFWIKGSVGMCHDTDDWVGGCLAGLDIAPRAADCSADAPCARHSRTAELSPLGTRLLHINGNALYARDAAFLRRLERFFGEFARNGCTTCACPRDDRIVLERTPHGVLYCGAFDTSLAEFLLTDPDSMRRALPRYRHSDFILNSVNKAYMPICVPANTFLLHKPWHTSAETLARQCAREGMHEGARNAIAELEVYRRLGTPDALLATAIGGGGDGVNMDAARRAARNLARSLRDAFAGDRVYAHRQSRWSAPAERV